VAANERIERPNRFPAPRECSPYFAVAHCASTRRSA
jgi:hypothetical protein